MQLDFSAPGEVSDYDPLCKGDCDFIWAVWQLKEDCENTC
jgi:hypothetical protein